MHRYILKQARFFLLCWIVETSKHFWNYVEPSNFFSFLFLKLLACKLHYSGRESNVKKMKVDKSFQINAKHLNLLFPLVWHVKYMPDLLITLCGWLKFVYVYHFFHVSEMPIGLIWSICVEMGLAYTKKQKENKKFQWLNLLTLFY